MCLLFFLIVFFFYMKLLSEAFVRTVKLNLDISCFVSSNHSMVPYITEVSPRSTS